jgi:hypothetical protein
MRMKREIAQKNPIHATKGVHWKCRSSKMGNGCGEMNTAIIREHA